MNNPISMSNKEFWDEVTKDWSDADKIMSEDITKSARLRAERDMLCGQLRDRMNELGLTQRALAKALNMQPSEVSRLLNSRANATWSVLARIANELGLRLTVELRNATNAPESTIRTGTSKS